MTSVSVIGAGAWGTALAVTAASGGRRVALWGRNKDAMAEMLARGENAKFLPGIKLPASIQPTDDLAMAAAADILVLAIPAQALRQVAQTLLPHLRQGCSLVAAAKGIEQGTDRFVTEILREVLPQGQAAILSGPSFANDVARGLPTAVTLAAGTSDLAKQLGAVLSGPAFRIYHSDDVRGVEIGGAAKNVLAIAAGIVVGAGLGESARAALIARGFAELRRLAEAVGARSETLMGLSGLGDLVLTASSPQSRNFSFGVALGKGIPVGDALAAGKLAEGAFTAPALAAMAHANGVEMPISEAVAAVIAGRLSVNKAISGLIERPLKSETHRG